MEIRGGGGMLDGFCWISQKQQQTTLNIYIFQRKKNWKYKTNNGENKKKLGFSPFSYLIFNKWIVNLFTDLFE